MSGVIPPIPNTPSWRGAQFEKSRGITLLLPLPLRTKIMVMMRIITTPYHSERVYRRRVKKNCMVKGKFVPVLN
jgi:hypothetical protein